MTFSPGETWKTLSVVPNDRNLTSGNCYVTVGLASGTGYSFGSYSRRLVTIWDDDPTGPPEGLPHGGMTCFNPDGTDAGSDARRGFGRLRRDRHRRHQRR